MTTPQVYTLERPTPDLIMSAVHNINYANLTGDAHIDFPGSFTFDIPPAAVAAQQYPYLATVCPELAGYSEGARMVSKQDPGFAMHSEPNWDVECYCVWPFDASPETYPEKTHYGDVMNARIVMMQVWGMYRDLDSQSALWTAKGITDPPSPWMLRPYGFERRFIYYSNRREKPDIAMWFGIRVTELLGRLPNGG